MAKAIVEYWASVYLTTDPILGEIMNITVLYHVADATSNVDSSTQFAASSADTQATLKASAATAIIADAAVLGYTLLATDIRFQDGTRGV